MLGKEGVGPALMIRATSPAFPVPTSTENAPQARSDPLVESGKRGPMAVFEILKPAAGSVGSDSR